MGNKIIIFFIVSVFLMSCTAQDSEDFLQGEWVANKKRALIFEKENCITGFWNPTSETLVSELYNGNFKIEGDLIKLWDYDLNVFRNNMTIVERVDKDTIKIEFELSKKEFIFKRQ